MRRGGNMPNQVSTGPTNSMHLYRVLEDEYINLYGPLPPEYPWLFLQSHIKDRKSLIKKIKEPTRKLDEYLKNELNAFFDRQVHTLELEIPESIKGKLDELTEHQNRGEYAPDSDDAKKLAQK